jgi:hypothetical protein
MPSAADLPILENHKLVLLGCHKFDELPARSVQTGKIMIHDSCFSILAAF